MSGPAQTCAALRPHIFLVAGEESGDRLGAALIAAIKRATGGCARFSGIGGAHMVSEGVSSSFPLGDLAIMGLTSIPVRLPRILQRIRETADAVIAARPDVLLIIDSPEFTHRVARRVRRRAPSIPIIDYVCPSVWAWRAGRARAMRGYIDHVLALLPFEPEVMQRLNGPPCTFVGHPLTEQVARLRPNSEEAARRRTGPPLLLVLPGSRAGEIRRMGMVFGEALALIAKRAGPLDVAVPAVPHLVALVKETVASWSMPARVITDSQEKDAAFRSARAALAKSGTSTLELALAGVPMAVAYKVPLLEEVVARLFIKTPSVVLANLILGENAVPEFLQRDCNAEKLSAAVLPLMEETPARQRQLDAFARLDSIMQIGAAAPSERAAAIVLKLCG